jgi:rhodanese-related sulfurtransferase
MKTAESALSAANAVVPKISVADGIQKHADGNSVFIDVRDGLEIQETGTIQGALKIPRGFIEFAADSSTPYHDEKLQKDAEIVLVCGAGGMAALTGHTLVEMGFKNVCNVGGFSDWKDNGGPVGT